VQFNGNRKNQLQQRLDELNARISEIEQALESKPNRDDEDRASETEDHEVLENLGLNAQREVEMIKAAFARFDDETYGFCAKCDQPIGEGRLDLLPYTPLCKNCAR